MHPLSFTLARLGSPGIRVVVLLGALSLAAPAATTPEAGPPPHVEILAQDRPVDTVPEPQVPFQVIAVAGALLIWRNRRRTIH